MLSTGVICLIGVGTVFFGLVCIVFLCMIMSAVCKLFVKEKVSEAVQSTQTSVTTENKQEIIAAVTCAIAQELGTDVQGIRVKSFKRL